MLTSFQDATLAFVVSRIDDAMSSLAISVNTRADEIETRLELPHAPSLLALATARSTPSTNLSPSSPQRCSANHAACTLIERVAAAAEERQFSQNSLLAYRRTWLKILAWAEAEGLVLETFPVERVGEFYEEATCAEVPRINSRFKAALALLYHVLGSPNPFAECLAPKFAVRKPSCATTPLSNWASCCANCARTKPATLAT